MQSPSNLPSSHFPFRNAKQEAARQKKFHCVKKNEPHSQVLSRGIITFTSRVAPEVDPKPQNRPSNFFPATFCSNYAGGDYNMRPHAFPTKSSVECLLSCALCWFGSPISLRSQPRAIPRKAHRCDLSPWSPLPVHGFAYT